MEAYGIIIGLAVFSYLAHNTTVAAASGILLVLKLLVPEEKLIYFGDHGLNWGVILLTAAMLTPIALGRIGVRYIGDVFKTPAGILSVVMGILVAIFGKWGVDVLTRDPQMGVSVMVGTIIGVVVFKGIPVGPLIASGIFYLFLKIFSFFFH